MVESSKMKEIIVRLIKDVDLYLSAVAFVFVTVVTFGLVITRYVYSLSLPSLEEVTMIIFVWFLYFSMIYCIRKDAHIRVKVIDMILKEPLQKITTITANVIWAVFTGSMCYYSIKLVTFNMTRAGGQTPMLDIPYYIVYLPLPFSFGVFTIFLVMYIYRDIRGIASRKK